MNLRSLVFVVLSGLAVSGCGTVAQNSDVGLVHVAGRSAVADSQAVQIVEAGPPLSASTSRVSGHSCRNKLWDPPPSRDNAIALMKRDAEGKGFNTVHSVQVVDDPAAIAKNCWSALIATGIAFKK